MFRQAVLLLLAGSAAAFGDINTSTRGARNIMKNARLIEGRGLENNNNMENVIANLYLKYTGCFNDFHLAEGGGGEDGSGIENLGIVTFELRESCKGALVGKYATNMVEFLDGYTESMMNEQEWRCEYYRENVCYCDNDNNNNNNNGQSCEQQCFMNAGTDGEGNDLTVCAQYYAEDEDEVFEVQRYLECAEVEANNNNNNNNNYNNNQNGNNNNNNNWNRNYNGNNDYANGYAAFAQWDGEFRVGPYCADDGKSVYLGVFYDEECTIKARDGNSIYANLNYGQGLPYSSQSLIPTTACITCADQQDMWENNNNGNGNNQYNQNQNNNGNNNQNWYNMEPREFCQRAYEESAKCEEEDSSYIYYGGVRSGCEFINSYLPALSTTSAFSFSGGKGSTATVFAWLFGISTVLFGAYAYFLYRKIKRGSASGLASQEGGALA